MGRPEQPVAAGPLSEFARDLRELRARTGLTYRALGRRAGYSPSALSAAASGHALPTVAVTLKFVEACGGDVDEWRQRWHELHAALSATNPGLLPPPEQPPEPLDEQTTVLAPIEHFPPLRAGDPAQVGPFTLVARMGSGAMAQVYLARQRDGSPVVVKVVRAELAEDPLFRRRFTRELDALRRMCGPGVAPVIDAGPDAERPWLAVPYTPALSLAEAVAYDGPLPVSTVWRLAAELADILATLREAGITHRDFSPANILLTSAGALVIDFGIAHAAAASRLTGTNLSLGTAGYLAPEQAEGGQVGPPADVFAFGCLLAFAATGRPPFGEDQTAAVLYRVVHGEPELGGLTSVDNNLAALIADCLHKDPDDRPAPGEIIDRCPATDGQWLPAPLAALLAHRQSRMLAALANFPAMPPVRAGLARRVPVRVSLPMLILLAGAVVSVLVLDTGAGLNYRPRALPPANRPAVTTTPPGTTTPITAPTSTDSSAPAATTPAATEQPKVLVPPAIQRTTTVAPPPTAPATAQVSECVSAPSRATCDRQDPVATGCAADAVTVPNGQLETSLHGTRFLVELRWSNRCQATWARVQSLDGPVAFTGWSEPDRHDATRYSAAWTTGTGPIVSPMSSNDGGNTAAAACVMVTGSAQPYYDCTPRLLPDGTDVGNA